MPRIEHVMRGLGIALLVIGYSLLVHHTNQNLQNGQLGALVAIAPIFIIGLLFAWRTPPRALWLTVFMIACGIVVAGWRLLEHHFGLVYWMQDIGMMLILFMTFARTLVAGRKPMCTHFAEIAHGTLTPQHQHYARQVTVAWVVFFAGMITVNSLLFFLTPRPVWSIFANFLTLPLIGLMFAVEYGVRRARFPEIENNHFLDAFRAYWKSRRQVG
jgi:uncharacterized membrane protein